MNEKSISSVEKAKQATELPGFNKLLIWLQKDRFYDEITRLNPTKKPWLEPGLFTPKHIEP
jgi:hypothetical protein